MSRPSVVYIHDLAMSDIPQLFRYLSVCLSVCLSAYLSVLYTCLFSLELPLDKLRYAANLWDMNANAPSGQDTDRQTLTKDQGGGRLAPSKYDTYTRKRPPICVLVQHIDVWVYSHVIYVCIHVCAYTNTHLQSPTPVPTRAPTSMPTPSPTRVRAMPCRKQLLSLLQNVVLFPRIHFCIQCCLPENVVSFNNSLLLPRKMSLGQTQTYMRTHKQSPTALLP